MVSALTPCIFVLTFLAVILFPWAAAETLPVDYSPYLLCSGVVDYDFYLHPGETAEDLNTLAINMMSRSWDLLSAECKSDMKRLTCARVYLPSTTNNAAPFKKPCRSICDATTILGTSCAGMMEDFGTAVNCSSSEFDDTNDPALCNAMESTEDALLVAEATEPYIGATCQGILGIFSHQSLRILTWPFSAPFCRPGHQRVWRGWVGGILTYHGGEQVSAQVPPHGLWGHVSLSQSL